MDSRTNEIKQLNETLIQYEGALIIRSQTNFIENSVKLELFKESFQNKFIEIVLDKCIYMFDYSSQGKVIDKIYVKELGVAFHDLCLEQGLLKENYLEFDIWINETFDIKEVTIPIKGLRVAFIDITL